MTNTQYEKDREKHVKHIQDVFKSMGISILAKEVIDGLPKQAKLKGKELVSDNRDSDHDYDPSSDIDNQTDSDDSDDFEEENPMVPGTRPKKQKVATMAATNQKPPRTPTRVTRQSVNMPSPGGRPPPRIRHPLPPKSTSKANPKPAPVPSTSQLQGHNTTNSSQTTQTTSAVPHPTITRTGPAMSSPLPNTVASPRKYTKQAAAIPIPGANPDCYPSPSKYTKQTAAMSMPMPGANPEYNPSLSTTTLSHQPTTKGTTTAAMSSPLPDTVPSPPENARQTAAMSMPSPNPASLSSRPTPATSVNQVLETSPGGQSSRQSNDLNESIEQFEAAMSEGQPDEGEQVSDLVPVRRKEVRKKTMGHGLEKMLNRGKKLAIQVSEGKKRPDVPLQAAKLASETGVALRENLPIYTSWKKYDNEAGQEEVKKVLRKVASRLDVDINNEGPSLDACTDIIKRGVRQTRYHLKRKYFDESLTKEQMLAKPPPAKMKKDEWDQLVEYWYDPNNQEKSAKNKVNREQVQLHQRTGSRSYIAHRYSLRAKYNNMEPDPVDFFGECMNSPKSGRTPLANEVYALMVAEKEKQPEEGQAQKSPSKIVADSLSQISRSSTFLPNIGVPRASKSNRASSTAAQVRMQAEFEERLQAEREEAARKQEELQAQLQAQQAALKENQSLLLQTQEEVKGMHNKFEETNALLRAVLKLQKD